MRNVTTSPGAAVRRTVPRAPCVWLKRLKVTVTDPFEEGAGVGDVGAAGDFLPHDALASKRMTDQAKRCRGGIMIATFPKSKRSANDRVRQVFRKEASRLPVPCRWGS